jgi:SPP1 family predicted phage head-tail adaptor
MDAGRLRHRVTIDERVTSQDEHGDPVVTWQPWASNVPAEIAPVSGKEFLAGQGVVAQVTCRIVIRWRQGVVETMRVRHVVDAGSPLREDVYNVAAVLPDNDSGRDHLTLMCTKGVNEG